MDKVTYTSRDLLSIAALTASLNVEGHRADLVILKTARAQAAFEGRNDHHRSRYRPGSRAGPAAPHQAGTIPAGSDLGGRAPGAHRAAARLNSQRREPEPVPEDEDHTPHFDKKKDLNLTSEQDQQSPNQSEPARQSVFDVGNAYWWDGERK